jgi:hypothetical protein
MTVYVVTGRPRTGTSMMMRAFDLGSSLTIRKDLTVETRLRAREVDATYDPNPGGYYPAPYLPDKAPPSSVLKVQIFDWERVAPGDYRVIWMTRDEAERQKSMVAGFGGRDDVDPNAVALIERNEAHLAARKDCVITTLSYADVVENPLVIFRNLQRAGWPITPALAAATVDPLLYRNK